VVQAPGTLETGLRWYRSWDFAGTEPTAQNPDPDWTAGALVARHIGRDGIERTYVRDGRWCRRSPSGTEEFVAGAASEDGRAVPIVIEQEPGQSGKSQVDYFRRGPLRGYHVIAHSPSGDKVTRQKPLIAQAERGELVFVDDNPQAEWIVQAQRWAESYSGDRATSGKRDLWDAIAQGHAEAPVTKSVDRSRKRRHAPEGAPVRPVTRI
jgi:phage terminase large subunit-like protein